MLLSRKLKSMINRIRPEGLEYHLENIRVNGQNRGCSGFIVNAATDKIVYVSTEKSVYSPLSDKNLYRTAKSIKDYTGGYNQFSGDDTIAEDIIKLLT